MDRRGFGFLFSLFVILFISFFIFLLSFSFVSAGLISSSGSIVSDGPLYDINLEGGCGGGEYCYGDSYCSDYSDSWDCESNGCTWVIEESGDCGVASIIGDYSYNARWNFRNDKGNKTGSATISYNNINYNIQCTNGICTQTRTDDRGTVTEEIGFPLDSYVFNKDAGWFVDFFSSQFECTMGLCGGSAINVKENLDTSKAVV
ncbi:hypothetical protein FJZ17_04425, partial [Candidatus Pacearchaeota archaeon]|nr:hypothetical protein [Candidatus Pacearchaeota archaeon]